MIRRTLLILSALGAAATLAACGPGAGKAEKGNPAMPPADPQRAARTNGFDKDGKPIDAVAAAEMPESELPPLKGAGPAPDVPPAPAPAAKP
ncbi:MAG: hypothetical protein K1X35_05135 [Caulobacteraceae bacterium]|nr:hypothetical protein [Caulobacteraceae bacterium]